MRPHTTADPVVDSGGSDPVPGFDRPDAAPDSFPWSVSMRSGWNPTWTN